MSDNIKEEISKMVSANKVVLFMKGNPDMPMCGFSSRVVDILNKREVKKYIDTVYLDTGYRNRGNIGSLLDEMIQSKLDEAQESGVYSSKDLADLLQMAHKMRMDEMKAQAEFDKASASGIKNQTNVQINEGVPFGQGIYGKLMDKLLNGSE